MEEIDIHGYQIRGNCRCCKFYHRVFEQNYRNIENIRGFCRLGEMEGDYALYVSTSFSGECPAFIKEEYNTETHNAELKLKDDLRQFESDLIDGRTSLYKVIKKTVPNSKDLEKFISDKKEARWISYHMNQELRKSFFELFLNMHKEQFDWLFNRKYINKRNYSSFLNKLRTQFDRFVCVDGLGEITEVYS